LKRSCGGRRPHGRTGWSQWMWKGRRKQTRCSLSLPHILRTSPCCACWGPRTGTSCCRTIPAGRWLVGWLVGWLLKRLHAAPRPPVQLPGPRTPPRPAPPPPPPTPSSCTPPQMLPDAVTRLGRPGHSVDGVQLAGLPVRPVQERTFGSLGAEHVREGRGGAWARGSARVPCMHLNACPCLWVCLAAWACWGQGRGLGLGGGACVPSRCERAQGEGHCL
jgi:hypothetical protein